MISIARYSGSSPPPVDNLLTESEVEGFEFVRRCVAQWHTGGNRFEQAGEVFLLAIDHGTVIGMGGLNIDPYASDPQIGRIRHVYVASNHRRRHVGRGLVSNLIETARDHFREVRLRTNTSTGGAFYRSLGFHDCDVGMTRTHRFLLGSGELDEVDRCRQRIL